MSSMQTLQHKYGSLQKQYDGTAEKLYALRERRGYETDTSERFKLDNEIKQVEDELDRLDQEANGLKQKIEAIESGQIKLATVLKQEGLQPAKNVRPRRQFIPWLLGGVAVLFVFVVVPRMMQSSESNTGTNSGQPRPIPDSTSSPAPTVEKPTAQTDQNDATSEMRKKQLNSDIRAREERTNAGGDPNVRADGDIKSEVRSKLEANLPASSLAVDAKDGAVTVTGSVVNAYQWKKIEPLAKQIKGVKSVVVKATISTALPDPPKPGPQAPITDRSPQADPPVYTYPKN